MRAMTNIKDLPPELHIQILTYALAIIEWHSHVRLSTVCQLWHDIIADLRQKFTQPYYEPLPSCRIIYMLSVSGHDFGDMIVELKGSKFWADEYSQRYMHKILHMPEDGHHLRYPLKSWNPCRLQSIDSVEIFVFGSRKFRDFAKTSPTAEIYGETTGDEPWRTGMEYAYQSYRDDAMCSPPVCPEDLSVTFNFVNGCGPESKFAEVNLGDLPRPRKDGPNHVAIGDLFSYLDTILRYDGRDLGNVELRKNLETIQRRMCLLDGSGYIGPCRREILFREDDDGDYVPLDFKSLAVSE